MLKMKKMLSLMMAVCLCFSVLSPCAAAEDSIYATREYIISEFVQSVGRSKLSKSDAVLDMFSDSETISAEYKDDISRAIVGGILKGYEDRTIRPGEPVKRVEAMVMLSRCVPNLEATCDGIEFSDVPEWAKEDIAYLSKAGLVKGYGNGRMGADDFITFEQVGFLVERSDEALRTVKASDSYYGFINEKSFRNAIMESTTDIDAIHGTVVTKDNEWSHFSDIEKQIHAQEMEILTKIINGEVESEAGSPEQRVRDMLECMFSGQALNDTDKKNIQAMRNAILDAKTLDEFLDITTDIHKLSGINVVFDVQIALDKQTGVPYPAVSLAPTGAGGLIAFRTKTDTQAYKDLYADFIADYLELIGADFARSDIQSAIELQIASSKDIDFSSVITSFIALAVSVGTFTEEEAKAEYLDMMKRNPDFFHPETEQAYAAGYLNESRDREDADAAYTGFDLCEELESYGFTNLEKIILPKSNLVAYEKDVVSEDNLNALKINAILRLEEMLNIALTQEETVAHERLGLFPMTVCITKDVDAAKEGLLSADGNLGLVMDTDTADQDVLNEVNLNRLVQLLPDDIGLIYTKYYYDDETSYEIIKMLHDIGQAYMKRFQENTWMDQETKDNAIKKLENMIAVIGYPDNYTFPEIVPISEGGSLFSNTLNIKRHGLSELIRANEEKEFVRTQMYITPDTVNAGYIAILNTINIPAGILNEPFYDKDASYEENLGAIGIVLAHEIGHAFDKKGAQYDENGCLNNWWTAGDSEDFARLQAEFVQYYSNFEVADGVVQDSNLTITENMADFAAMQIIMDIVGDDPVKQKECLESFARMWASIGSVSYVTRSAAMNDVHSRNVVRVNAVVSSFDAFYEIYDVKEGDPMYVAPEERLKLW